MAGGYVAYVDYGVTPGVPELWLADVAAGTEPIAIDRSGGIVGAPAIAEDRIAYRVMGGVGQFVVGGPPQTSIEAPGSGRVAVSPLVVAWEQDDPHGQGADVAWKGLRGEPVVLAREGRQHSVVVSQNWIAFVDDSDGAVHLIDTGAYVPPVDDELLAGGEVVAYVGMPPHDGVVAEVAIHAAGLGVTPTVAVIQAWTGGAEVGILAPSASSAGEWIEPVFVETPTGKSNLHVFADWVAFDETTFGEQAVRLVNWRPPMRTFSPIWKGDPQSLSHLSGTDAEVRLVWTEEGTTAGAGLDVWELMVQLPLPPVDGGSGSGVTCDSATAEVIGSLELLPTAKAHPELVVGPGAQDDDADRGDQGSSEAHRKDGWHISDTLAHDESWHGDRVWRQFGWDRLAGTPLAPRRVVACIDAIDVASAWVVVGEEVVAAPADFAAGTRSMEAHLTIPEGEQSVAAVVIAAKGGTLHVRVLDDPEGDANGPPEGSTCSARGDCPRPPGGILGKFGCGSSGGAGTLASLLLVGLLVVRPSRRRSHS